MDTVNTIANTIVIVCSAIIALLSIVEKSKSINAHPLSNILGINDIKKEIKQINDKIVGLDKKTDLNDAKTIRNRVLNLEYLMRSGADITEPQLRSIIKDIHDYYSYKEIYKELDGEIELAKDYLEKKYKELF